MNSSTSVRLTLLKSVKACHSPPGLENSRTGPISDKVLAPFNNFLSALKPLKSMSNPTAHEHTNKLVDGGGGGGGEDR